MLECDTDEQCSGASDTCVSFWDQLHQYQLCYCGSNPKCSGRSDKCTSGLCSCGETDECPEGETCWLGKCQGL